MLCSAGGRMDPVAPEDACDFCFWAAYFFLPTTKVCMDCWQEQAEYKTAVVRLSNPDWTTLYMEYMEGGL